MFKSYDSMFRGCEQMKLFAVYQVCRIDMIFPILISSSNCPGVGCCFTSDQQIRNDLRHCNVISSLHVVFSKELQLNTMIDLVIQVPLDPEEYLS